MHVQYRHLLVLSRIHRHLLVLSHPITGFPMGGHRVSASIINAEIHQV
jgi:hypothetical protein